MDLLIVLLVLMVLALAAVVVLARKLAFTDTSLPLTAEWIDELSIERYRPMMHLLDDGDALQGDSKATLIYATQGFAGNAHALATMLPPSRVIAVPRAPGVESGVTVVLGPAFTGQLVLPQAPASGPTILASASYDAASWKQLDHKTKLHLRMPKAWVSGYSYDWAMSRAYSIPTGHGNSAAAVVVGTTTSGGYWHIEEMRWTDPPAIASPDATKTVKGTRYLQFYNGTQLHMVAWKTGSTLYWVSNTLDNEIANDAMMALATSFARVK